MEQGSMKPTIETFSSLDKAYDYFNRELFAGKLPPCIITLHRKKGAHGYFWGDTWHQQSGEKYTDEIALNPETIRSRSLKEVLSTLVHEMCHLQQHHFGAPSRNGYHNAEWAKMMEVTGLVASDIGQPGGKKTGQRVSHYIKEDGPFAKVCDTLLEKGFSIPWHALTGDEATRKKKRKSKTKYSCESCGINAWAKPDTALICGSCMEPLQPES